ncbi:hypothetical protein [Parachlamydia sp. AcF125]|uniref:hypothetical protein n=1 Tax=Parachlamydia sp. AcF125 TaxID=2795736 RepID=UPI001BC973DF|nr:hypothetical protein [Parachlamydia sp. AcF125]
MVTNIKQVRAADIIVISDKIEAFALRGVLEAFGVQVRMHYIGNVNHLISLLQGSNYLHKMVVISCHGNKEEILIPELAPELELDMLYRKGLTPRDLQEILSLDDQIVIITGCCLGSQAFAEKFLSKGAKAYIGAKNYIDGDAFLLFTVTFLYFYLTKSLTIKAAFKKAKCLGENAKMIKLWQRRP